VASEPLLSVDKLSLSLSKKQKLLNEISFSLHQNEVLSLVGESGSGKSLTAASLLQLFPSPQIIVSGGSIHYKGKNLVTEAKKELREIRRHNMGYIPQNPMSALNPTLSIGFQLREVCTDESNLSPEKALELVSIPRPKELLNMYPHELSGGMQQRVLIAMNLLKKPEILIADEPTTALDVTVQAQILHLLQKIKNESNMSILFITHDLSIVNHFGDRVLIMNKGEIVESGKVQEVFTKPSHPYTQKLLEATYYEF